MLGQVTDRSAPREACLHRGEERVLIGLAAHGPHTGRGRSRGVGALHISPRLSPCALDPRRRGRARRKP